ncbi:hypothetical protein SODALDRAFT_283694 [Sodiomyces alkalinus F11]|uniref:Zn(2)-C6 fungal-type domain-containing protein n=1 Tax=Sodiomyces alkalinus (strain CBS 110278 / VKM F-3762 / F11) TaxID=1314773 RepID=A0A3N2PM99_SODAK|nr:hypothetical protein SODALDRAFT_283694 [Sodiomyces alkalinus F11]ROT35550.1 hypothetical protein SODALDRAFT_283694 [Sodiomyces alkalinus F11]
MAGPGGGPPRRSHTKSRKGCDTCKRRHIRCDEVFPQCRNCTKHKIRCPYNDIPVPHKGSGTPDKPDLMWTNEIVVAIREWRRTGTFPFPSINLTSPPHPSHYSDEELRLIYHVSSIFDQMAGMNVVCLTIWTSYIPAILNLGTRHRCLMDSLLAFSAMHIASLTDCPIVGNMAYEHRGRALGGLKLAIGTFSGETLNAALAASLLLSWQATDWRTWTQLMQGACSVTDVLWGLGQGSEFYDLLNETGSSFPRSSPAPSPDHQPSQPPKENLDALNYTLHQLYKVELFVKQCGEDSKPIQQLAGFLRGSRKIALNLSAAEQFERLRPLRTWLFSLPVMLLQEKGPTPATLVTIAHYYTVAILLERLFPEIGTAFFGNLCARSIVATYSRVLGGHLSYGHNTDAYTPVRLMQFPMDTATTLQFAMGLSTPAQPILFPQMHPPNVILGGPLPWCAVPQASSYTYVPYGDHAIYSYSPEFLPMASPEFLPMASPDPLLLPGYTDPQQLSIPSPVFAGYSPASSNFEGSIAYSDPREDGMSEIESMPPSHIFCSSSTN